MLQTTGLGLFSLSVGAIAAPAASTASSGEGGTDASASARRFSRMMQEWCIGQVADVARGASTRRAALHSKAEVEAYIRDTTAKAQACFGRWPERTPLKPRVTGVVDRGTYRIEKVIYESRPDFLVTGNLYLPTDRTGVCPAVLGLCGHQASGKLDGRYQAFAQKLVQRGCAVFIIDPIGQGERSQYLDASVRSTVRPGTRQHFLCGNQQVLIGEFLGAWRAWDAIRAIDYLVSRPEIDARRLGVTGHSGGGTMTTWLCALEPRLTAAVPVCCVSTFLTNLENELTGDPEQYPPGALARGLDITEFLVPLAPKALLVLGEEKDFADVRGLEETAARVRHIYERLGATERFSSHVGPGYHDYSDENQAEMLRWFGTAWQLPDSPGRAATVVEPDAVLLCTPQGQVAPLGSRSIFSYTRETSLALGRERPRLAGPALAAAVDRVLRLPPRKGPPHYRILRPLTAPEYQIPHVASYAVETEPGIHAIVYRLHREDPRNELVGRPPRVGGPAVLYVSHLSADAELRGDAFLRQQIAATSLPFFTCDVRGIGESQPEAGGLPFRGADTSDYLYAAHGLLLDYPYLGQRTHDLLQVLEWLRACGHTEVHLIAAGWGTLPASFAALRSPMVTRVTLRQALVSFSAVAETEYYQVPLALLPPGLLREFDLPDLYRELEQKHLALIQPWNPDAEPA